MNGIIPLYKPRGMTSFDCVTQIKRLLHTKKVGHTGTLDPNVDGILLICVGKATKVVEYLMNAGKTYQGTITLGFATTTEDLEGEVIEKHLIKKPFSYEKINYVLNEFVGETIQKPPLYSAIKVKGQHLYSYARQGITVKVPERIIKVNYFKQIAWPHYDANLKQQFIKFQIECGKGTYIRSLAVAVGKKLEVPAVMSNLTRISNGNFKLKDTVTFTDIKNMLKQDTLCEHMYPIDYALSKFKYLNLTKEQWEQVKHGAFLNKSKNNFQITDKRIVLKYKDDVKALYQWDEKKNSYKPLKMFSVE